MFFLMYFGLMTMYSLCCVPLNALEEEVSVLEPVYCGRNQFLELIDEELKCQPCPEGSFINETEHNLTSCQSRHDVIVSSGKDLAFLANEIAPYFLIGSLLSALAVVVAYTYHCWYKKIPGKINVCKKTADVENDQNVKCLVQNEHIITKEKERKSLALAEKVVHMFKKVWSSSKIKMQFRNRNCYKETVSYSEV